MKATWERGSLLAKNPIPSLKTMFVGKPCAYPAYAGNSEILSRSHGKGWNHSE